MVTREEVDRLLAQVPHSRPRAKVPIHATAWWLLLTKYGPEFMANNFIRLPRGPILGTEDTMAKDVFPTLHPAGRDRLQAFVDACEEHGHNLLVYCGYRSLEEQARLYRQGRTRLDIGRKIDKLTAAGFGFLADIIAGVGPQNGDTIKTMAAPGESFHNAGLAIDAVLLVNGKPDWDVKDVLAWRAVGDIALAHGIEWAGRWTSFKEMVHFQVGRGANPLKDPDRPGFYRKPEEVRRILMAASDVAAQARKA